MQASVYRLRQHGIKLPRPQSFVAGELLLSKGLDAANRPTLKAQLLGDDGSLALPSLEHASITRITRNGIAIAGTEVVARRKSSKSSADFWPQTWWCLVITAALGAELVGDMTLEFEQLTAPRSATGF
jgi:hypothetical protein